MRKWQTIKEYEDIKFDFFEGIAKITINSTDTTAPKIPGCIMLFVLKRIKRCWMR